MTEYPGKFKEYLAESVGQAAADKALSSSGEGVVASVRANPLKPVAGGLSGAVSAVPWSDGLGFMLGSRPVFTLDPLFHAGAYYVQDSSSMYVGHVFSRVLEECGLASSPLRVLDLCAAPGGKTTDIVSRMPSGSVLVSNEVMAQRAGVLRENVSLWGSPDVIVTSNDPKDFGDRLGGYFDVILADVPCSGEGMFRKDPDALSQWSPENVSHCVSRQKRILADVWPALRPGGVLIYSTCTFNRFENSGNIAWLSETFGAVPLAVQCPEADAAGAVTDSFGGKTFVWGIVPGEGQYCAAVRKPQGPCPQLPPLRRERVRPVLPLSFPQQLACEGAAAVPFGDSSVKIYSQASLTESLRLGGLLKIIQSGVAAGTAKGRDFVPDADLALSCVLRRGFFPELEMDRDTALKYLARENVPYTETPRGYVLAVYGGLPLGFLKSVPGRFNTLHPQSRRIRMDIRNR